MRYAIFLKEINLSIFSFFSYLRNLNNITINGKQGTSLTKITKGQFEYIRQEIKQQEKGYGLLKGPYLDSYDSYWTDWPGTLVTK